MPYSLFREMASSCTDLIIHQSILSLADSLDNLQFLPSLTMTIDSRKSCEGLNHCLELTEFWRLVFHFCDSNWWFLLKEEEGDWEREIIWNVWYGSMFLDHRNVCSWVVSDYVYPRIFLVYQAFEFVLIYPPTWKSLCLVSLVIIQFIYKTFSHKSFKMFTKSIKFFGLIL